MKKFFYSFLFLALAYMAGASPASAQDFVYQARNPAFGGDTFNYQWLQSSAQSQDKLKDPDATTMLERNALQDFKDNLNRQILNQLSRQFVVSQFGEDSLQPGSYTIGDYQIEVTEGGSGINIQITDTMTGDRTTVTVPYY
ncbi:curli assembly protein CsgF [Pontibacter sp. Tf4]|uniref:curli production assembly/transport component CsgF n=1 Tax=Pontibacter sp. Tf4 TaxID=2761620 RepID=UPI001629436D|nr:curli production assembly/transport component CsgF [Pontibacter sp. Tf4]MBB6612492.1 curli assembly protein CsgF [Pontibacter sp. Tf4]